MLLIRLLLTLAVPMLLGYCLVALITKKTTFLERFGLAWGIGIGLLGISMFTLSLIGIRLTLISSALPALICALGLAIFARVRKYPLFGIHSAIGTLKALGAIFTQPNRPKAVAEKLLALLIILVIGYVFFDALVKPIVNFDDLWRQGCIARIVFETGQVITKQTLDLAGPHPFLDPLSQAWIYLGIGTWNDALGKIVFAFCFTSLLFIFYSNLRANSSRLYSLFFTYLLTSFPLIVYHAGTAYSDLMQTFYYSVGAIYLYRFMKERSKQWLYVSAIFLGIGNFVKQSGIPLWGIATVVLFIYLFAEERKNLKPGGLFFLLSAAISIPWLLYQNSFLMRYLAGIGSTVTGLFSPAAVTGAEASTAANLPYGPPTILSILFHLGKRMFTYSDWQILWFVFILALIFCWQNIWQSRLKYLLMIILLDLGMVIYAFNDPVIYQFLVDGTLVNRVIMYQIPLVLYFIAEAIKTFIPRLAR